MTRENKKDTSGDPSVQHPESSVPVEGFTKLLDGFEAATQTIRIPPGHVALSISLVSGYKAFRDFSIPLDSVLDQSESTISPKTGKPELSYSAQVTIARRAFSIAAKGLIASTAFCGALFCYSVGWKSFEMASSELKHWTRPKDLEKNKLIDLGNETRDHPDFEETKNMNFTEEWNYISDKYFPKLEEPPKEDKGEKFN